MGGRIRWMGMWAALLASAALAPGIRGQAGDLQFADLGTCKLQSGEVIEQCRVGYRTFGALNAAGSNAVLFPTAYRGRSQDLSRFFGPHAMVDTTVFFGVAIDSLGDGNSSSPSNSVSRRGSRFPEFTIQDMVDAEYRLATEVLRVKHVHAVVGVSMGGMQVFDWIVRYPDFMDCAVAIVGTPRQTAYDLWSWHVLEEAIEEDPGYHHGDYTAEPGLKLANALSVLRAETPAYRIRHTTPRQFPQAYQAAEAPQPQDANDRMWQLRAMLAQDVTGGKTISETAQQTRARLFVAVSEGDLTVNPAPAIAWAKAADATLYESRSDCGHNIFDCDRFKIEGLVRDFLAAN